MLTTLSYMFIRRETDTNPDAFEPEFERNLETQPLAAALAAIENCHVSIPGRIDALLIVGRRALEEDAPETAETALQRAQQLDPGRADVWVALAEWADFTGDSEDRRRYLELASALEPTDTVVMKTLGDAWLADDPTAAGRWWERALARSSSPEALVRRLEGLKDEDRATALRPAVRVGPTPGRVDVGAAFEIEISVSCDSGRAVLYILEPFGGGVLCEPHGRIPFASGDETIRLHVRAMRPDVINGSRPWRIRLAASGSEDVVCVSVDVAVRDPEPGRIFYVVTEDHELYDGRRVTTAAQARTTLVDKSQLAQEIANQHGARWTHMVDVGSQAMVAWAARESRSTEWRALAEACQSHLLEAVASGNDLGLHIHGFHDPTSQGFCHVFDEDRDCVLTQPEFLETSLPERRFWSREFEPLGDTDTKGSRAWGTWKGIAWLESIGRLADPRFRVTLFRAGSYDIGDNAAERARSMRLLSRLGFLADTDVPKPRLYHRMPSHLCYPISDDPAIPEIDPARVQLAELRAEYNIEADFLSDVNVLNHYVDHRLTRCQAKDGSVRPGVHIVCSMTHDKLINWRMGRSWDSLDPDYGDWQTIGAHLRHVTSKRPLVEPTTVRQALIEWHDYHTPELRGWRDEEIVEVADMGASEEIFRYRIRLLGRGIEVCPSRRHRVVVNVPAWSSDRILRSWIESDGQRWPSSTPSIGSHRREFDVHDRDAIWELVVVLPAGDGVQGELVEPGVVQVWSRHRYRCATLMIPPSILAAGTDEPALVRGVAFSPEGSRFCASLALGNAPNSVV